VRIENGLAVSGIILCSRDVLVVLKPVEKGTGVACHVYTEAWSRAGAEHDEGSGKWDGGNAPCI